MIDGKKRMSLELIVKAVESQTENEVRFTWSPLDCTEQVLRLQLNFDQPGKVSSYSDANSIIIKVWDTAFFVRSKDRFEVAQVTLESVLPL